MDNLGLVNGGQQNKRRLLRPFFLIFAVLVLMFASFFGGAYLTVREDVLRGFTKKKTITAGKLLGTYSEAPDGVLSEDIDFALFWQTWDVIKDKYVDQEALNEKLMFYGALKGLVASVGDPYTVFMDPVVAQEFSDDLAGTFEGIGAEIGIKSDTVTIIAPLPDMPAEKAGLQAGDMIIAIDEESTAGMSLDQAIGRIRGEKGTVVKLTILRKEEDPRDFTITRDTIHVKSITTQFDAEKRIFTIKISNFNNDTQDLFNQAVREALEKAPAGLIVDLRNDPGGYLDTAIEIASEWVEEGVVVAEKSGDKPLYEHLARGRARLSGLRTVVLVNRGSASASEILAGALKDYGLATIVGEQTFGKGSVQMMESLPDGSSIKITTAKWLTPKGTSIADEGITPDLPVELTGADYESGRDPQQEAAEKLILGVSIEQVRLEHSATSTATSTTEEN